MINWEQIVRFETPENIAVNYRLAGPGTRFVACVFDHIIIFVAQVLLFVLAMIVILALLQANVLVGGGIFDGDTMMVGILVAAFIVFQGFFYIGYFTLFEWIWNGQTPGARTMNIRVVMDKGFSLSFAAVFLRNVFRIIDAIPVFWIVPVVTRKLQRFGDMVAGTLIVREDTGVHQDIRARLGAIPQSSAAFAFNQVHLNNLRAIDLTASETFLARRERLHPGHRQELANTLCHNLMRRIGWEQPVEQTQCERFIEDLLSAHARQEARDLA